MLAGRGEIGRGCQGRVDRQVEGRAAARRALRLRTARGDLLLQVADTGQPSHGPPGPPVADLPGGRQARSQVRDPLQDGARGEEGGAGPVPREQARRFRNRACVALRR